MAAAKKKAETATTAGAKETAEAVAKNVRAKVAITYRDKYDKKLHKAGEVVTVTSERFKELNTGKKRLVKM